MHKLTWGLLVATHNRPDALKTCVSLALGQSRLPVEVVVVDSSIYWKETAAAVGAMVGAHPDVRFVYRKAEVPSLTVQRNQALAESQADIVFLIDDDSFMHPTCAEEIMRVYEADAAGEVAGVQAKPAERSPGVEIADGRKAKVNVGRARRASPILRWIVEGPLMIGKAAVFIPYDGEFPEKRVPEPLRPLEVKPVRLFGGFRMTYRREQVLREGFDPILRYYCPGEDLDASYRISRHGALLTAMKAPLYHHASTTARLKRRQVAWLWSLNQAVLLRRHAANQPWARRAFALRMGHRVSTDFLKDLLMRRWDLPQSRGSFRAWVDGQRVFGMSPEEVEAWYPAMQERIVTDDP